MDVTVQRTPFVRSARVLIEHLAMARGWPRTFGAMPPTPTEVADQLYARWNDSGLAVLTDSVDPDVELICDPLCPAESVLRGIEGWNQWAARWEKSYETMHITIDGLIPMGAEHVLALVSITATPRGGTRELRWAAAHVWTVRNGRIVRWESHVDLALARGTLL